MTPRETGQHHSPFRDDGLVGASGAYTTDDRICQKKTSTPPVTGQLTAAGRRLELALSGRDREWQIAAEWIANLDEPEYHVARDHRLRCRWESPRSPL